jgi:hypothetical protein
MKNVKFDPVIIINEYDKNEKIFIQNKIVKFITKFKNIFKKISLFK